MPNTLIKSPTKSCTLYELEDHLEALANSIAMAEDEPMRQLILDEIGEALRRTKEKRDSVVAFLRHCALQQKSPMPKSNVSITKAFIASVERPTGKLRRSADRAVRPARSKGYSALGGNLSSMRIQKNPDSVSITDLNAIPSAYKHVTVTMPAYVREAMLMRLGPEDSKVFDPTLRKWNRGRTRRPSQQN